MLKKENALKRLLCIHRYIIAASKSNFYGSAELYRCSKCGNDKVVVKAYPEWGDASKTTYKHYNTDGTEQ